MIHLVDAGGGEPAGLIGREQPEAGADVEIVLRLDLRRDVTDEVDLPLGRPAGRDHDAERLRLPLGRSAASLAASISFGAESRLYRGISASETFDCEQ